MKIPAAAQFGGGSRFERGRPGKERPYAAIVLLC
jgi:hypothetical protein